MASSMEHVEYPSNSGSDGDYEQSDESDGKFILFPKTNNTFLSYFKNYVFLHSVYFSLKDFRLKTTLHYKY